MWKIIPQLQRRNFVEAKVLQFCPVQDSQNDKPRFKRIPPVVQVVIGFGDTERHTKLKYSVRSGTYTMQLPDKWIRPTIKLGKQVVEDRLAQPVVKAGEKKTYASSKVFFQKLNEKVGADLAAQIERLFIECISSIQ